MTPARTSSSDVDLATRRRRARRIVAVLGEAYPDAHCELDFTSPLELLVATVLSAQCTDQRVNTVTPALFARYPTAADYAAASLAELEGIIAHPALSVTASTRSPALIFTPATPSTSRRSCRTRRWPARC